jgi:hypothetical protein
MIPNVARFLIHPDAVPHCAWNSTLGWNRQLTRILPDARLRQSAGRRLQKLKTLLHRLKNGNAATIRVRIIISRKLLTALFGFEQLPLSFMLVLEAIVVLYVTAAENVKRVFYSCVKF